MLKKWLQITSLIFLLLILVVSDVQGVKIKNPYHKIPRWKLWYLDATPVNLPDNKIISPPKVKKRLYPDDADIKLYPGRFLAYRNEDWPQRKYAGTWFDVYSSRDKGHSNIKPIWKGDHDNYVKIYNSVIHLKGGPLHAMGANFTSQSTTGMGHDITNNEDRMSRLEKYFYFADILTSGPAHISFRDHLNKGTTDRFQALAPIIYNSVGSSGSETMALTKMIIAGGYLPKEIKPILKLNGIYPSSILYLWKASLPYLVPYDNELRHRVAFNSAGDRSDDKGYSHTRVSYYYNNYNDTAHMRNMVNLAKSMSVAPPIALLKTIEINGGKTIYSLKTTLLVHQGRSETIKLRISTEDCYDLQELPLNFRWKVLYGNKDTSINKEDGSYVYNITIPKNNKLPKGRTSILLVANNGKFDSNPAIVNVYRTDGVDNLRPTLIGLEDKTILPGEKVEFDINSIDPEGFPVTLYRWAEEVGSLDGNTFTWECPPDQTDATKQLTIIASDGTCGNSYNSRQIKIQIRSLIAVISADKLQGNAPLKVSFSSFGSRDKKGGSLSYFWEFDDGATSREQNPIHAFTKPGFYQVTLKVKGLSGAQSSKLVIFVRPQWSETLFNGWESKKIDTGVWQTKTSQIPFNKSDSSLRIYSKEVKGDFRLTSVRDFSPPLYLEAVYKRSRSKGGTGFQVLGTQIGYPADPDASNKMISIGHPLKHDKSKWVTQAIVLKYHQSSCRTLLRVFADHDPDNRGKIRFSGYLQTETGTHFFKFDNQDLIDNKIAVLSASLNSLFEIYRLQVWTPEGDSKRTGFFRNSFGLNIREPDENICSPLKTKDPQVKQIVFRKINLEGNGLNIKNGASRANLADHTDFGGAVVAKGSVARSFTIRNLSHRELMLVDTPPHILIGGKNPGDFVVLKKPKSTISKNGSSIFKIKFQPQGKGLRSAQISISYRYRKRGTYTFHVQGRGI